VLLPDAIAHVFGEILHELLPLLLVQLASVREDFLSQILTGLTLAPLKGAMLACALKVAMIKLFGGYSSSFEPSHGQEVENR
jgi:hypothetical protein